MTRRLVQVVVRARGEGIDLTRSNAWEEIRPGLQRAELGEFAELTRAELTRFDFISTKAIQKILPKLFDRQDKGFQVIEASAICPAINVARRKDTPFSSVQNISQSHGQRSGR